MQLHSAEDRAERSQRRWSTCVLRTTFTRTTVEVP